MLEKYMELLAYIVWAALALQLLQSVWLCLV